ncbi:MAG: PD40 domain-containing protein [Phycisphaerae bacterium]|nr:PD40 domain-containing protein [Phycisphaerae bacterium]
MLFAATLALAQAATPVAPAAAPVAAPTVAPAAPPKPAAPAVDWRALEAPALTNHLQLTFPDRFLKAGESYFSADDARIIFQAIEVPADDTPPADFYAMYVADVVRGAGNRITGIANIKRISPAGSANTCGWFHPKDPNIVLFGSTVEPPSNKETPGYQRGTGRYRWQFPPEMRIVQADLRTADGTAATLKHLVGDGAGYVAEGSLSADGRTLLYTAVDPKTEGDLWVRDMPTGVCTKIVSAPGYDGGPFFSPDDARIIYRSDRRGNSELQVFTADLVRDGTGMVTGVTNERPMTDNAHVNWCPFFHPDGHHFVYGTSEVGHSNYEVFMRDDRAPELRARMTWAGGADVLPVFSHNGKVMMWTCQRGPEKSSQIWIADFNLVEAAMLMKPVPAPTPTPDATSAPGAPASTAAPAAPSATPRTP